MTLGLSEQRGHDHTLQDSFIDGVMLTSETLFFCRFRKASERYESPPEGGRIEDQFTQGTGTLQTFITHEIIVVWKGTDDKQKTE